MFKWAIMEGIEVKSFISVVVTCCRFILDFIR